MAGGSKSWKGKIRDAKRQVRANQETVKKEIEQRLKEARAAEDWDMVHELQNELSRSIHDREFQITGMKKRPKISDPVLYESNRRNNAKKRGPGRNWAPGGKELAREQRATKKKNIDSPVSAQGSLATVSRDVDRWEMSYGTQISLLKGSVVMPMSDTYMHREKMCVTVMAGANIFKGVPVAVLRPIEDEE